MAPASGSAVTALPTLRSDTAGNSDPDTPAQETASDHRRSRLTLTKTRSAVIAADAISTRNLRPDLRSRVVLGRVYSYVLIGGRGAVGGRAPRTAIAPSNPKWRVKAEANEKPATCQNQTLVIKKPTPQPQ